MCHGVDQRSTMRSSLFRKRVLKVAALYGCKTEEANLDAVLRDVLFKHGEKTKEEEEKCNGRRQISNEGLAKDLASVETLRANNVKVSLEKSDGVGESLKADYAKSLMT